MRKQAAQSIQQNNSGKQRLKSAEKHTEIQQHVTQNVAYVFSNCDYKFCSDNKKSTNAKDDLNFRSSRNAESTIFETFFFSPLN